MPKKTKPVKRPKTGRETMAEIAATRAHLHPIHKSYGEREDLRLLAVCNNINGPIAPSGLMTLDDKKVTCKRCLRIIAGKPVARATARVRPAVERGAEIHAALALGLAAVKLVEQLALCWTTEGARGDEPGSAKEAFELLVKQGYTLNSTRTLLYRPDGSEVVQ
jgi:hypothetical protein